jgi:hypothetical protein
MSPTWMTSVQTKKPQRICEYMDSKESVQRTAMVGLVYTWYNSKLQCLN